MGLTRRTALGGIGAAAVAAPGVARAQARAIEPTATERAAMDAVAEAMLAKFDVPGLSVAIAAGGRLVHEAGFGVADASSGEKVTPRHLFRVASVSKPITAVAIFTLVEAGRLRLTDKVFGPGAVLGVDFGAPPYKGRLDEITIEHLLTHTAGGWPNDATDPMFKQPGMDHRQLISWVVANQPPANPPGQRYAYSNFGFCILGRVVEKVTGERYESFVRSRILERCGAPGMRIAGNTRAGRAPGEVAYHGDERTSPYAIDVARMDSHGGWLASAPDLVRFLTHLDGSAGAPGILRPETLRAMTAPSAAQPTYARGWRVDSAGNYRHTGSLSGTTTLMLRAARGLCWAALTNGRRRGAGGFADALDRMMWDMVGKVRAWR